MVKSILKVLLAGGIAMLTACGGSESPPGAEPFSVELGAAIQLKAGRSTEVVATVVNEKPDYQYQWQQVSGPTLLLQNTTAKQIQITAPALDNDQVAVLALTVTDKSGKSAADTLQVALKANQLPTLSINDVLLAEKSQAVLSVNAGDADGQISKIEWAQTSGPALQFTASNSAELAVRVPAISKVEFVTFAITVTDDDGATQTVEHRYRLEPNWQEFTLGGFIVTKEMAGADIIAAVNGEVFRTQADANANYQFTVKLDDDASNDFLLLRAISTSKAGMDLMLALPSLREKDPTVPLDLTPYSTAIIAMAARDNNGIFPLNRFTLQQLEQQLNSEEVAETALIIAAFAETTQLPPADFLSMVALVMDANSFTAYQTLLQATEPELLTQLAQRLPQQGAGRVDLSERQLLSGLRLETDGADEGTGKAVRFYQFGAVQQAQVADEYFTYAADWALYFGQAHLSGKTAAMPLYQLSIENSDLALTPEQVSALQQDGVETLAVKINLLAERLNRLSVGATKSLYQHTIELQYDIQPVMIDGEMVEFLPLAVEIEQFAWGSALNLATVPVNEQQLLGQWQIPSYRPATALDQSKIALQQLALESNHAGFNLTTGEAFSWGMNYYLDGTAAVTLHYPDGHIVELRLLQSNADGFTADVFVKTGNSTWLAAKATRMILMHDN